MSNRSRRGALTRAEARRRSRQLERGEAIAEEPGADDTTTAEGRPPASGGMLARIFPPAPPLPNRPDPLAGLRYDGPLRSVVAAGYLLANNPRGWLLPAIPWATAQSIGHLPFTPPTYSPVQIPVTLVNVFAIIAAGWIGWQRPWLFGLVTAVAGTLIEATFRAFLLGTLGIPNFTVPDAFLQTVAIEVAQLQWILAAFIGWYGGYLRRRLALTASQTTQRRRRTR
jgi:hypothetical protein